MKTYPDCVRLCIAIIGTVLSLGCGADTMKPVYPDPEVLPWRIDVDRPVVLLSLKAPYDTVRITAIPVNVRGIPLALTEPLVFKKRDPGTATFDLTQDGLITAKGTTTKQIVDISTTVDGVIQTAKVFVMIRNDATVPSFRNISIQPTLPDSGVYWSVSEPNTLQPKAYLTNNNTVSTAQWFSWCSSDAVSVVQFGEITSTSNCGSLRNGRRTVGDAWIKIRAFAYGKDLVDSVLYRFVEPPVKMVQITRTQGSDGNRNATFQPSELSIQAGGTVVFANPLQAIDIERAMNVTAPNLFGVVLTFNRGKLGDSVDVVFDDSAAVLPGNFYFLFNPSQFGAVGWVDGATLVGPRDPTGLGGNIEPFTQGRFFSDDPARDIFSKSGSHAFMRSRKFTVPGVYHYRSLRFPKAKGTITVR